MPSLWNRAAQEEILSRVDRLQPDLEPRWGRLTCPQMVVHVTDAFALYSGSLDARGRWTPLRLTPVKQAFIYLLPIPKNVPTAPELISRVPGEWDAEIERLGGAVRAFCARPSGCDWPAHPIFGRISRAAWGALAYKHTDHHLRQFGV